MRQGGEEGGKDQREVSSSPGSHPCWLSPAGLRLGGDSWAECPPQGSIGSGYWATGGRASVEKWNGTCVGARRSRQTAWDFLVLHFHFPKVLLPGPGDWVGFSMMTASTAPLLSVWLVPLSPSSSSTTLMGLGFPGPSCGACSRGLLRGDIPGAFSVRGRRHCWVLRGFWGGIGGRSRRGFIAGAGG